MKKFLTLVLPIALVTSMPVRADEAEDMQALDLESTVPYDNEQSSDIESDSTDNQAETTVAVQADSEEEQDDAQQKAADEQEKKIEAAKKEAAKKAEEAQKETETLVTSETDVSEQPIMSE